MYSDQIDEFIEFIIILSVILRMVKQMSNEKLYVCFSNEKFKQNAFISNTFTLQSMEFYFLFSCFSCMR